MATGAARATFVVGIPDARTRSIWLTQLVLAATVLSTALLVMVLEPALFGRWSFLLGVILVVVLTLATLALPWARLSAAAVLAIPFADALAIGLMSSGTELRLGFLWGIPVMWVAMHFRATALAALLAVIGVILLVDSALSAGAVAALRGFVVLLTLTFIGITAHIALRRTRSLRRLLRRQAGRLTATFTRRADQERRTTEILNGIDTGIARLSADGAVLAVNDAYSRLYGLDPLDPTLPARSIEYTGLRGMPVPLPERPFTRAARGETFTDASVWLFTAEGEWRALSVTAKRLAARGDEESSILLLVHDVTALTYAQRERERFTAMASHELKHPLTVMIGNAELALDLDDLTPRTRERFETIIGASERMLKMTESLVSTSRRGFSGRDEVDDIDLRQILMESVASFRPTAAAAGVQIDVQADQALPITADGFRLRQVVDNVVSNAIKYTPRDGRVQIVGAVDDGAVVLSVADTGIGIAAEDLPNILTPYFRTAEAKKKSGGSGLGLGISNDIVTAHGGTLSIDSDVGVGTRVDVRFPLARTEHPHPHPDHAAGGSA
ncbi:PAS domain-containing sensor histidine kinase [Microbacterium sp. M3]|uniref:histidine kinase n=1 Tax=Microbacterium arthrosphaerae TaxID=792652 RepID=A0ABU4H3J5_9MICO|nr:MULTISPECIES: PAS domain-containing sensor histidine kinase [Microbacterium]MDW4573912.1 PAS domain-containing sensor histidine kinase [Microbacterium arthrosphaerae]MDW7607767.1 PAS domain-containing sensor histidine kinase [Microbacterium sp. M3]